MIEMLSKACKDKAFIAIYSNLNDTSKFIFGRILCFDNEYVAIYSISTDGLFDGIIIKTIDDIIRLEFDSQYCKKMLTLCLLNELPIINYEHKLKNQNVLKSFLDIIYQTNELVSIELLNSGIDDIIGFIEPFNGDMYKVNQVDWYGKADGWSIIALRNITRLSYSSN